MNNQEFDMLAEKNPYIQSAYEQLQIISQDDKKQMEYEAREKAIRDYNYLMSSTEKRGKLDAQLEIAVKLYNTGWQIDDISNLIGISTEILNENINKFVCQ